MGARRTERGRRAATHPFAPGEHPPSPVPRTSARSAGGAGRRAGGAGGAGRRARFAGGAGRRARFAGGAGRRAGRADRGVGAGLPRRIAWLALGVPALVFALVALVMAVATRGGHPALAPRSVLMVGVLGLWATQLALTYGRPLRLRHVLVIPVWFVTAVSAVTLLCGVPHPVANLGGAGPVVVTAMAAGVLAAAGAWLAVGERPASGTAKVGRLGAADTWCGTSRSAVLTWVGAAVVACATSVLAYTTADPAGPEIAEPVALLPLAVLPLVAVPLGVLVAVVFAATATTRIDPDAITVTVAAAPIVTVRTRDLQRVRVADARRWGIRGVAGPGAARGIGGGPGGARVVMRRGPALELTTVTGARIVIAVDDPRSAAVLLARHMDRSRKTTNIPKDFKHNRP